MSQEINTNNFKKIEPKKGSFEPKILGFLCNWCAYAGADLAGVSRYQFPPNIRLIRVMCSSRVDPVFIFRAFAEGIDAVFVGGCHLADCHYIDGNYGALRTISICKKILEQVGLNPKRLKIEWISAAEGLHFANTISDFIKQITELGPLEEDEEKNIKTLKLKLQAAEDIVPYLKLVEGKKLRLHFGTEAQYDKFFSCGHVKSLFHKLVIDKLIMTEILLLLRQRCMSVGEISEILSLSPSEVSRMINSSVNKGLVSFDEREKRFIPA
jgi:coenzyme F420-reducing hydrogenase delta subunit/predicted XRE-type DNA-binding protein